jgi:hypothetical protein
MASFVTVANVTGSPWTTKYFSVFKGVANNITCRTKAFDVDADGIFRLADAVFVANVWSKLLHWNTQPCNEGDFDRDGFFKLVDAVFVANTWSQS